MIIAWLGGLCQIRYIFSWMHWVNLCSLETLLIWPGYRWIDFDIKTLGICVSDDQAPTLDPRPSTARHDHLLPRHVNIANQDS